eukprot:08091.XXX_210205_210429_1 [CDS] Oithona nana genome sequencing.
MGNRITSFLQLTRNFVIIDLIFTDALRKIPKIFSNRVGSLRQPGHIHRQVPSILSNGINSSCLVLDLHLLNLCR